LGQQTNHQMALFDAPTPMSLTLLCAWFAVPECVQQQPQGPHGLVINCDGSKGWTFGGNAKALQGR
jgi:hypothetical protein